MRFATRSMYRLPHGRNWSLLYEKYRYVVHHRNLLLYLEKGMRLKRLCRGIQFREEDWMRPYIEMNTQLRQQSTSNFERDHFKKMVKSVYGKTCGNQKKRSDIKLTTNRQQHLKLASKPHCRNQRIFNEGLAVVDMEKNNTSDQPAVLCRLLSSRPQQTPHI